MHPHDALVQCELLDGEQVAARLLVNNWGADNVVVAISDHGRLLVGVGPPVPATRAFAADEIAQARFDDRTATIVLASRDGERLTLHARIHERQLGWFATSLHALAGER
jgi:hypothetical protein